MTPEKLLESMERKRKSRRLDTRRRGVGTEAKLRERSILKVRRSIRHHIEGIKVVVKRGNDMTPEKLRQIQQGKRLAYCVCR